MVVNLRNLANNIEELIILERKRENLLVSLIHVKVSDTDLQDSILSNISKLNERILNKRNQIGL